MELLESNTYSPEIMSITLKSSDGQQFQIDIKSAKRSTYIADLIEEHKGETEFLIPEVEAKILKKIVEYLIHYKDSEPKEITQPLPKKDFKECVDDWDYEYINLQNDTILELMLAANFMDIKPLLELTCAKIASVIKGKSPEEIQNEFKMEKDFDDDDDSINSNQMDEFDDDEL